jgi:hypothetical protein
LLHTFWGIRRRFVEGKGKNTDDDDDHNNRNNRNRNNITSLDRYKGISESRRKAEKEEGYQEAASYKQQPEALEQLAEVCARAGRRVLEQERLTYPKTTSKKVYYSCLLPRILEYAKKMSEAAPPSPPLVATYESIG